MTGFWIRPSAADFLNLACKESGDTYTIWTLSGERDNVTPANNAWKLRVRNHSTGALQTYMFLSGSTFQVLSGAGAKWLTANATGIYPGNQTTGYITCEADGDFVFTGGDISVPVASGVVRTVYLLAGTGATESDTGTLEVGIARGDEAKKAYISFIRSGAGGDGTISMLVTRGGVATYSTTIDRDGNMVVPGTLTVNGDQTGAVDHVFDAYDDIELLRTWRQGGVLPFALGDLLNRDRLLRDSILQEYHERGREIAELRERVAVLEAR